MSVKKAKAIAYSRKQMMLLGNKKPKTEVETNNDAVIAERSHSLALLAAAANQKNALVEQQLMFQHFMRKPESAESEDYFAVMSKKYKTVYSAAIAKDVDRDEIAAVKSVDSLVESPVDDDDDGDFDELGRYVPTVGGSFCPDTALRRVVMQSAQPVIDYSKILVGSDFSQDSNYDNSNPGTPRRALPSTQNLLAALQNAEDHEDSQLTTLSK